MPCSTALQGAFSRHFAGAGASRHAERGTRLRHALRYGMLSHMARTDPHSTARLERLRLELDEATKRFEAEILRLASLDPPAPLIRIAKAARLDRDQIRNRERDAGLAPRLPGGRGRAPKEDAEREERVKKAGAALTEIDEAWSLPDADAA